MIGDVYGELSKSHRLITLMLGISVIGFVMYLISSAGKATTVEYPIVTEFGITGSAVYDEGNETVSFKADEKYINRSIVNILHHWNFHHPINDPKGLIKGASKDIKKILPEGYRVTIRSCGEGSNPWRHTLKKDY